jgi:hypothetical protein
VALTPGCDWGEPAEAPQSVWTADGDRALSRALETGVAGPYRVTGGDLARTIGCHRPRMADAPWRSVPVDVIHIDTEHGHAQAVAHVLLRGLWWKGPVTFIANAEFRGTWDIAPRAHPGDGLLDLIEMAGTMSLRARIQAWQRVKSGTHLPHPDLRSRQVTVATWRFARPQRIWVDGSYWQKATEVHVKVLPAALSLLV